MTPFLYFDFEYRDNEDRDAILMMAFLSSASGKPHVVDLRTPEGHEQLRKVVSQHSDHYWVAYNAMADLTCLATLGIDIASLKVIDVMVEARMIMLTHPCYQQYKPRLLNTLHTLGLSQEVDETEKSGCRDLILNQGQYTVIEWQRIAEYCVSDILPLPRLLSRCWDLHSKVHSPITIDQMAVVELLAD